MSRKSVCLDNEIHKSTPSSGRCLFPRRTIQLTLLFLHHSLRLMQRHGLVHLDLHPSYEFPTPLYLCMSVCHTVSDVRLHRQCRVRAALKMLSVECPPHNTPSQHPPVFFFFFLLTSFQEKGPPMDTVPEKVHQLMQFLKVHQCSSWHSTNFLLC